MKMLDEVIKAMEYCENALFTEVGCGKECPYYQEPDCLIQTDALHYLKEYQSDQIQWEAARKGYENWIEQYNEVREKHQNAVIELKKNPPLTWDELKQMEGKPVWIEPLKEWMLITDAENENLWLVNVKGLDFEFTLHDWQAYRKERE